MLLNFPCDAYESCYKSTATTIQTVVGLKSIKEKTKVLFNKYSRPFSFEETDVNALRRLRRLLTVILHNENIVELDFICLHIPGSILAKWINKNKYVTKISYDFHHDQSDLEILCDAIRQNNVITSFCIENMHLQGPQAELFGKAICESKAIVDFHFTLLEDNQQVQIMFLQELLGPNSNIKYFDLSLDGTPGVENANTIKDIISANKSLVSFRLYYIDIIFQEIVVPILQGVVNSVQKGFITDFDIDLDGQKDIEGLICDSIFQMIGKMKSLKSFSFELSDFYSLSADTITKNLIGLHSMDNLKINAFSPDDLFEDVIKNLSSLEKKCKLHINIWGDVTEYVIDHFSTVLNALDDVQLEKFTAHIGSYDSLIEDYKFFVEISKHVPNWKFLKELNLRVDENFVLVEDQILKFATEVYRNVSLEEVSVLVVT